VSKGSQIIRFADVIRTSRRELRLSQVELAGQITKACGNAISPQYINDIEHGRRVPKSDRMLTEFARVLGINLDWLYYLAGRYPVDIYRRPITEDTIRRIMRLYRSVNVGV